MKISTPISRPERQEYPDWYAGEIELVPYDDLLFGLEDSLAKTLTFLQQLPADLLLYRYQPGKWTIKEMWQHIIDVERVLGYRALRFARRDATVLHGFNENTYAENSEANGRTWEDIVAEYAALRTATIWQFNSFTPEMLMIMGTAGRSHVSVRAVGYLILGHETHHVQTIRQRYLDPAYSPGIV